MRYIRYLLQVKSQRLDFKSFQKRQWFSVRDKTAFLNVSQVIKFLLLRCLHSLILPRLINAICSIFNISTINTSLTLSRLNHLISLYYQLIHPVCDTYFSHSILNLLKLNDSISYCLNGMGNNLVGSLLNRSSKSITYNVKLNTRI